MSGMLVAEPSLLKRCPAPGCSRGRFQACLQAQNLPSASSQGYRFLAIQEAAPQLPWKPATHKAPGDPELHPSLRGAFSHAAMGTAQMPVSPPAHPKVALGQKMGAGLPHPA